MAETAGEDNGVDLNRFRMEPEYAQQTMIRLGQVAMDDIEKIECIEEQKAKLAEFNTNHDELFKFYQEFHGEEEGSKTQEYGAPMKNGHGFCTCTNHYKPKISATMKLQHDIHSLNIGEFQKRDEAEKHYASMMKLTILNPPPSSSLQEEEEEDEEA